jgi:hypothetical protein
MLGARSLRGLECVQLDGRLEFVPSDVDPRLRRVWMRLQEKREGIAIA